MRVVGTSNTPHSSLFFLTLRRCVHIGYQSRDIENEEEVAFSNCLVNARYPDRIAISRIAIHSGLVWTGLNMNSIALCYSRVSPVRKIFNNKILICNNKILICNNKILICNNNR